MVDSSTLPVLRCLIPNLGWQILRGSPGVARNSYLVFVSCYYAQVVGKQVLSSEVFFALFTNRPLSLSNQTCSRSSISNIHCVARFPLCRTISTLSHELRQSQKMRHNATQYDMWYDTEDFRQHRLCEWEVKVLTAFWNCAITKKTSARFLTHDKVGSVISSHAMQSCHPMPALVEESPCGTSLAVVIRAVGPLRHLGANDLHLRIHFNYYKLGAN